jgi:UDP-glucose 4-epimerase
MTQETWLLTGGAGYISAHIADEFIRAGRSVVIYDSLYQGLEHRISYLRTKHNIDIAKRNNVEKFIFSSTAAVYGTSHSMAPCKEDGPTSIVW